MKIYFEYPSYLLIAAALIAVAISLFLYYKDKSFLELEAWKKRLLFTLRFIFVFIILALLLNPIYKSLSTVVNKPIVVFVQDNSNSILLNKDSAFYKTDYKNEVDKLLSSLSEDYDVKYLQFSEFTNQDSILDFSGELSDISSVFPEVISRFSGMNLGAVILATDGIYNKGSNPIYSKNTNFPVYCIALGDTISQKDLILKDIMHNRIAFYGNKFPLRIFISAEKCSEKESQLIISKQGKQVYSNTFELPENSTIKTIELEILADKLGIQQYDITLKPLSDEISYDNNKTTFVIDVIDNRQKVLLLGNAPHPDIGAIKSAIKDNPDFELEVQYINDYKDNVKDFDLVILHQLPSPINKASNVFAEIEKFSIPTLFIIGTSTSITTFNSLNSGLEITSLSSKTDDAVPYFNSSFLAFSTGINNEEFFSQLSPLKVFFGDYKFNGDSKVFLYQTVNGVKTQKPLIAFVEKKAGKNGFILGEGIWKWRIDDFKFNSEHTNFNAIFNRIVQYLIVKKIQNKLTVDSKRVFNENESVILNSEFYNDAYELVPNLEVSLVLKNSDGKEFKYSFGNFGNSYRLDLGRLSPGNYKYTASTSFDKKDYSTTGEFIVKQINVEALVTTANHNLLYKIAEMSAGKVFYPKEMQNVKSSIKSNSTVVSVAYKSEKLHTITDLFLLFFVILIFAATEWVLRKYWGSY